MSRPADEERALGLSRTVADTAVGRIVARIGERTGGDALLLVHGAAGSWRAWLPLLRAAAEEHRPLPQVVAVDLPGWGESPDPAHPLDAPRAAAAVVEVARAAGAERWTVVGHSLGGLVALEVAAREPVATRRVVLVSPTGPAVLRAIRQPVRGGVRLPWFAGMLLAMRALALLPGGGRPLLRALGRSGVLGRLAAPLFVGPVDASVLHDLGEETRPAAFVRAAHAARDVAIPRLDRPVRMIRGSHDVFVGPGDAAAFAATLRGDLHEHVIQGVGHFALAERPAAVLEALDGP